MNPRYFWNAVALGGLTALYAIPAIFIAPWAHRDGGRQITQMAKSWARWVLRACGVQLVVEDFDRELSAPAYLVLANHTSYFDVPAIFAAFPRDLCPVAKRELGRIPLFGWALSAGAAIMIDRGDAEKARISVEAAGKEVRSGRTVLIFPEGTRSATHELQSFKKGPFYLALEARVPILPIAVLGAQKVWHPREWCIQSGHAITVRMGTPIETTSYDSTHEGRAALSKTAHEAILRLLEERDPP